MFATIRFLTGPLKKRAFTIEEGNTYRLGRDESCEILIDSRSVSRTHAKLHWMGDALFVEDLDSTNGVELNGEKVGRAALKHGGTVVMGSHVFRVESVVFDMETSGADTADESSTPGEPARTNATAGTDGVDTTSSGFRGFTAAMQKILGEHKNAMIEESLRTLATILPVSRLSIVLVDQRGKLRQGITVSRGEQVVFDMSRTFARKVLESGEPVVVKDAQELDMDDWGTTLEQQKVRSIMGAPVFSQGKPVAVLLADNLDEPSRFTQVHLRQLVYVSKVIETAFQQEAFAKLDILSEFVPICASCKRIREDGGYWRALENYFHAHADIHFSHTMCPECLKEHYPEMSSQQPPSVAP